MSPDNGEEKIKCCKLFEKRTAGPERICFFFLRSVRSFWREFRIWASCADSFFLIHLKLASTTWARQQAALAFARQELLLGTYAK